MVRAVRSPNYPVISLREAADRIELVWSQENKHPADKEIIAQTLGYGTLNGASMGVISALTKYGLLESAQGGQLKVSATGMDMCIYGSREPEHIGAVRAAAFRPALFNELYERYGSALPSDNSLRSSLVKKGFNPKTVDGVIRAYRDTIQFLDEESGGMWLEDGHGSLLPVTPSGSAPTQLGPDGLKFEDFSSTSFPSPGKAPAVTAEAPSVQGPVRQQDPGKLLIFSISEDAEARIEFRGPVTQESIDKLLRLLELQQDTFPKRVPADDAKTAVPASVLAPDDPSESNAGGDLEG